MNSILGATAPQNAQELADLVQTTVTQIEQTFEQISETILNRVNQMGQRIDELERTIAHLISQTEPILP